MIIEDFSLKPFPIDSHHPRLGLLLNLQASNGRKTTVEASPLPGFSSETFEDAKGQLIAIRRAICSQQWSRPVLKTLAQMELFPSVHFAIETGLLDLLDPVEKDDDVQTYSLLLGTKEEILKDAQQLAVQGVKEIKIKLGHLDLTDACQIIDPLVERFSIRLDFNRKWTRAATLKLCQRYEQNSFLYIEEPCQDPSELIDFPLPFALDESLRDTNYLPLLDSPNLKKLILKPTLAYPITPFIATGIPCIVTSSFESTVGISQLRRMIKRLGLEGSSHGLDTLRHLSKHDEMPHCLPTPSTR